MSIKALGIHGAWIIESKIWEDERGFFREWFKHSPILSQTKFDFSVKQANLSISKRGTLRGIHYSLTANGQSKLVTCAAGQILDLIVDLREDSPTFKKFITLELDGKTGDSVLIGQGLGHAFLSLEDNSVVTYLLDSPYSPGEEYEINPFDVELAINWPLERLGIGIPIMSAKDQNAPTLAFQATQKKLPKLIN